MDSASALIGRLIELEKPKLDRRFGEGGVEVEHVVAAAVVVMVPAVVLAVAGVPDVCKIRHGLGLSRVDLLQESGVNRAAVAAHAAAVQLQGFRDQAFVAGHDVGEVSKALRGVALGSDVDVNSASSGGVALCTCVPELSAKFLQGFNVLVGQDRCDQFAFLLVRPYDGNILLEFPLPALCVPGAPGTVAVTACGVLVSAGSEEPCGDLCCLLAGDVVHLDLDSDGLLLHGFDLAGGSFCHGVLLLVRDLFSVGLFPFGSLYITLKHTFIK